MQLRNYYGFEDISPAVSAQTSPGDCPDPARPTDLICTGIYLSPPPPPPCPQGGRKSFVSEKVALGVLDSMLGPTLKSDVQAG